MKKQFIYVVVDIVASSIVQSFFAVSDAEAIRKVKFSLEKEQIPSVMKKDLRLYRVTSPVCFPETYDEAISSEQLTFDFDSTDKAAL